MIKKLLCLLGMHKWRDTWRRLGLSGMYMKQCRRCGKWEIEEIK